MGKFQSVTFFKPDRRVFYPVAMPTTDVTPGERENALPIDLRSDKSVAVTKCFIYNTTSPDRSPPVNHQPGSFGERESLKGNDSELSDKTGSP